MRVIRTGLYLSAAVLGLVCNAAPVAAQSAGGTQASGGGLEEVVVTANRRSESVQAVPIAVSVVSASNIRAMGVTDTNVFDTLEEARGLAEPVPDGRSARAWSQLAQELDIYLVAGVTERDGDALYNSYQANRLFWEADSGGLIRRNNAIQWQWRHAMVERVLRRIYANSTP